MLLIFSILLVDEDGADQNGVDKECQDKKRMVLKVAKEPSGKMT